MECPDTAVFHLLVAGQLPAEQRAGVADHAASCPRCHQLVSMLVTEHGRVSQRGVALAIGGVVGGRFRIDDILGAGGMGFVVAATHLELRTRVALKFLRDELIGSPAIAERFVREARAVVGLRTEHVCRVFDVARLESGAPYIVMELLDGVDLARTVLRRPLPMTFAVEYVMQACVALAEAHAAGLVHRDLKPANLFVIRRPDGAPLIKVLDFGIAKATEGAEAGLTRSRMMLGSPGYMSPEQLDSPRDVDARADIWALGVTLYQLLSARLPFAAASQAELAVKITSDLPAPIEIEPRLREVIWRCLEKSPERRYRDVAALADDLVAFGGPGARRIAAAIGGLMRPSIPVGLAYASTEAAPTGPAKQPTPVATVATGAEARRSEPVVPQSRPGRRRLVWPVVAGVAVLANVIVIALVVLRGSPAQQPAPSSSSSGALISQSVIVDAGDAVDVPNVNVVDAALIDASVADAGIADAASPVHRRPVRSDRVAAAGTSDRAGSSVTPRHDPPAVAPPTSPPAPPPASSSIFVDAGVLPETFSADELRARLAPFEAKLQGCAAWNHFTGAVLATFHVTPAGKCPNVSFETHGAFEACLTVVCRTIAFPETRTGANLTLRLEFH